VCWIYGWTRLTVPAVLALMHALRRGVIPWKLACTACCTARLHNLVWTSCSQDFESCAEEQHHRIDLVYSILSRMER
jgi:hypothetical protein